MNYVTAQKFVDVKQGIARAANKPALFVRLLNMFLKSEEPAKLRAAISENNIPLMSDVSHAIKGIAGNLSLNLLFEVATKLNTELKTGVLNRDYYEEYEDILNSTIEAVNAVITEISSTL